MIVVIYIVIALLLAALCLPLTVFPRKRPGLVRIWCHAACSLGFGALAVAAVPDGERLIFYAGGVSLLAAATTAGLLRQRAVKGAQG